MIFKVDSDNNIVAYVRAVWDRFPAPYIEFKIKVENVEYITSKRNLKSKCTSFGKIYDLQHEKITHKDFCDRHGLRIRDEFEITEITPFEAYRLNS